MTWWKDDQSGGGGRGIDNAGAETNGQSNKWWGDGDVESLTSGSGTPNDASGKHSGGADAGNKRASWLAAKDGGNDGGVNSAISTPARKGGGRKNRSPRGVDDFPSSSSGADNPAQSKLDAQLRRLPQASPAHLYQSGGGSSHRGEPRIKGDDSVTVGSKPRVVGGSLANSYSDGDSMTIDSAGPQSSKGVITADDYAYEYGSSVAGGGADDNEGGAKDHAAYVAASVKAKKDKCSKNMLGKTLSRKSKKAGSGGGGGGGSDDKGGTDDDGSTYSWSVSSIEGKARRKKRRCIIYLLVSIAVLVLAVIVVAAVTRFGAKDGDGAAGSVSEAGAAPDSGAGSQAGGEKEKEVIVVKVTEAPTTISPTLAPTDAPTTAAPTDEPTSAPTQEPTEVPTKVPTAAPTDSPTAGPTEEKEVDDKDKDDDRESPAPTDEPTQPPTLEPTEEPTLAPTPEPTDEPTAAPSTLAPTYRPTLFFERYVPGNLTKQSDDGNLLLSAGMSASMLIESREIFVYPDGEESERFHGNVRGAGGIFSLPDDFLVPARSHNNNGTDGGLDEDEYHNGVLRSGGYAYLTNSEKGNNNGETGAIYFSSSGEAVGYSTVLDDAARPDAGGKTPWGTWIACEGKEGDGKVWEVDPTGAVEAKETVLGDDYDGGGECAGFAFDDRNKEKIHFYLTENDSNGPLRRYTPSRSALKYKEDRSFRLLHQEGGTWEYLVWVPEDEFIEGAADDAAANDIIEGGGQAKPRSTGQIVWLNNEEMGKVSAEEYFGDSRGIARHGKELYFVSEEYRRLMVIDLDARKFRAYSTENMMAGTPNEITVLSSPTDGRPLLFVTDRTDGDGESGGGVTVFDPSDGTYTPIIRAGDNDDYVSALAFSPDGTRMYAAWVNGDDNDVENVVYSMRRKDGKSFGFV